MRGEDGIPMFSGKPKESFRAWFEKFEIGAEEEKWNKTMKVVQLPTFFTGLAEVRWFNIPESTVEQFTMNEPPDEDDIVRFLSKMFPEFDEFMERMGRKHEENFDDESPEGPPEEGLLDLAGEEPEGPPEERSMEIDDKTPERPPDDGMMDVEGGESERPLRKRRIGLAEQKSEGPRKKRSSNWNVDEATKVLKEGATGLGKKEHDKIAIDGAKILRVIVERIGRRLDNAKRAEERKLWDPGGTRKHWLPPRNELEEKLGVEGARKLGGGTKGAGSKAVERPALFHGTRPLVTPIYHTSTFTHPTINDYLHTVANDGYIYQRLGNPTCEQAEVAIAELEGGVGSLVYASGMAAISSVLLAFLKAGDHLICQEPCYSGTMEFLNETLVKFGVEVTYIRAGSVPEYKKHIKANTRMLYGETPANPAMILLDLEEFGKLGNERILTAVDSTFASPALQQPLKFGVDISLHSCTKYLGGHSDLLAGSATVKSVEHWKKLKVQQSCIGTALAPMEAALLSRGIKSLHLRMERHSANAIHLATFLQAHPKVKRVMYPGLASHPQHEVAKKQMAQFGGMIAFEMEDKEAAIRLVENLRLINLAVSLGGVESLITCPFATTHGPMLMEDSEYKVSEGLIRFSVGVEDVVDLEEDLRRGLDAV